MQLLVLLDEAAAAEASDDIAIVHAASQRLFVAEASSIDDISGKPGVIAVTDSALPNHLAGMLDDSEAVFASAFAIREVDKDRKGEGLPWDAPGFEPPDPPAQMIEASSCGSTEHESEDQDA